MVRLGAKLFNWGFREVYLHFVSMLAKWFVMLLDPKVRDIGNHYFPDLVFGWNELFPFLSKNWIATKQSRVSVIFLVSSNKNTGRSACQISQVEWLGHLYLNDDKAIKVGKTPRFMIVCEVLKDLEELNFVAP